jgi:hypothetical protein
MYKSSSSRYIRSENPVFRWGYLCKSTSPRVRKFKMMARIGVPQSEWCSTLWGSTNEAIAPPVGGYYNVQS